MPLARHKDQMPREDGRALRNSALTDGKFMALGTTGRKPSHRRCESTVVVQRQLPWPPPQVNSQTQETKLQGEGESWV